jgi:CRP/FNR family transcriptional regulator, transcriptional activator FtrB
MLPINATADDLQAVPVLRGLSRSLLEDLAHGAELIRPADGTLLVEEGRTPERLFILLRGAVELFVGDDEREPALAIVWPPETLVPAAALSGKPYLISARTLGRCTLLSLDAARVRRLAREDTQLAGRMTTILCGQYRMLQRNLKDLRLRDAPHRLAAFLYRLVQTRGTQGCADLPVPKYRLAARLGITPESVSRALALLQENGVRVRGSRVIVTDRQRLELFCAPDPLIDEVETELLATAL